MEYQRIQIEPLKPHLGAIITSLDLSTKQYDGEVIKEIMDAYRTYQLLLFRDTILRPEEQIRFSQLFGKLETFPYRPTQIREHPEIFRLSTNEDEGYLNVGFYWHQDGSFRNTPTATSIFHLVKVPHEGGETLFANAYEAYEKIPEHLKELAEKMKTIHEGNVVHDLVITHPVTGKKALYLNLGLVRSVKGFETDERDKAEELMSLFKSILDDPKVMYTHEWKEGDLIVADNYSVFHQATETKPDYERTLHRTSILGEATLNS
ncbi:MAG: TauD/TfdA family dioxygenase [Bacteroidota bacterium]